ncbi:MAG: hypothetical protein WKF89_10735 [Chitinophagaceae bacterium]
MKKANGMIHRSQNVLTIALVALIILSFGSCARKIRFEPSPVVPAAQGRIKIKKDNNDNYALQVSITHLAEARRLEPPKETYVVWVETERNGTKNIGQMKSSSGLFSKKLKASLNAVTSYKPTRVIVTAEYDGSIQYPGPQVVLITNRFY